MYRACILVVSTCRIIYRRERGRGRRRGREREKEREKEREREGGRECLHKEGQDSDRGMAITESTWKR